MNRRWLIWIPALLLTGALVMKGQGNTVSTIAEPAVTRPAQRGAYAVKEPTSDTMILEITPRTTVAKLTNAFGSQSWTPPPPKPAPVVPAEPTAPPLPFTFLGKQQQDGRWTVFLGRQDQTFIVAVKDVIESTYSVDEIAPPSMTLTYLPLNTRQTVAIGGTE